MKGSSPRDTSRMRTPAPSRRAVLGAFAAMLWPSRFLFAQNGSAGPGGPAGQVPDVRMIAVEGEGARYWSRWRGPSGQGLASGSGYPDTWSATQNILWKTPVPGRGNSSPVVWRDRIFLSAEYDGGRRLSVLAFRRADGARLWETFA